MSDWLAPGLTIFFLVVALGFLISSLWMLR